MNSWTLVHGLAWLGVALPLGWWGWLQPNLRGMTALYDERLSEAGKWEIKEKALLAGGWTHDDGFHLGRWGGKEWVQRLVREMEAGKVMQGCENSHKDGSLVMITNHLPPETMTVPYEQWWLDWWRQHGSESREQWVQSGFVQAGFPIHLPVEAELDWPVLLRLLGAAEGPLERNGKPDPLHASHLRHNAWRWLRDSGFEPTRYLLEHPEAGENAEIRSGLLEYEQISRPLLVQPFPGAFALEEKPSAQWAEPMWGSLPVLAHPKVMVQVEVGAKWLLAASVLVLIFSPRPPWWPERAAPAGFGPDETKNRAAL